MKQILTLLTVTVCLVCLSGLLFTGCTKEGPQGPQGEDANATCTLCHNFSDDIVAKIFQYDASQHATGSTTFENAKTCAACHTSQGFIETYPTGSDTTAATIEDPAPINCRTCHNIHQTYTIADWNFRTTAAFTNRLGQAQDMTTDKGDATGNLCARCHQVRKASPWVTNPTSTTDSLKPTSKRWGPHHGPQSLVLAGLGGFETGAKYSNSYHTGRASCVDCHGAEAVGNYTGGHSLRLVSEEEGDNYSGCNVSGCHDGLDTFDYDGVQTEVSGLLEELKLKLQNANVLDADGYIKPGKNYCQKMMATVWNFKMVEEDRSLGVHNYKFSQGMLEAGINYLTSLGY
jgi:hypothetical protein